ncbi:Nonribosomal peptide synthetase 14-like protein 1 [Colletotrichum chlorophyti]|uniref:Nonribosomal peptide synthetase 14-like protein 1 n=1 Tax=Colletotrichum chlorophyti TaxID=708187 RepID=A0A1Q8RJ63_9PEZI|nr:Nonribosomal peptide synthetase 14-like protein 1 [Colletotrichum chlorophyti]
MNGYNQPDGQLFKNNLSGADHRMNAQNGIHCEAAKSYQGNKQMDTSPTPEPIAVIGTALRFPGGATSPSKLWEMLRDPPSHLSRTPPEERFGSAGFFHPDPEHHGTSNSEKSYFLDQDIRLFDAPFFNIAPREAEAIDPQHRLLLEVVYEALEAGGIPLEKTRGTDTAVYVGQMSNDYWDHLLRDVDSIPKYMATGTARSITANRLSYFFDWHGPSLSIDTACSSSMVALHQAVQALRAGQTGMAVAAGCHLVLGPESYVIESKLRMISPTGTCKMWDAAADGYARAEGCAALVLKTVSSALRDGDPIMAVVRETGVNQDGRTRGITMPSAEAQAALIKETYLRAGLDPSKLEDQPQFFEAHGTGTQAGDPIEAEAIHLAFFADNSHSPTQQKDIAPKLPVGSIKTVVGHLEAAAGIAGIIKAIVAMRNRAIPPNLWFEHLNPKIEPFYKAVRIPTETEDWPISTNNKTLRCSVNSFGFGGTNAHTILESYEPKPVSRNQQKKAHCVEPITFSAGSASSLSNLVQKYKSYLTEHPDINLADLAFTLQSHRSALPYRLAFSCTDVGKLVSQMSESLNIIKSTPRANMGSVVRLGNDAQGSPKLLGIFTGQGAQWPGMGRDLLSSSKVFADSITRMEESLASLPDPPAWSLFGELMASKVLSTEEASIAQPLSLALQVGLVDLLHASGVKFDSVVAHSSGEIAAAYTSGLLTAHDAIRIAYYRGKYSTLAKPGGCMMAVGLSYEEAQDFCSQEQLKGRVTAAASNAPKSTTLSGSLEALKEAAELLGDTFHRLLKVDKAYHSAAMIPCCKTFQAALDKCGIKVQQPNDTLWISSVREGQQPRSFADILAGPYWVETLYKPVLFSQALSKILAMRSFDGALEIGPHPALKGPSLQTHAKVAGEKGSALLYKGVLERFRHDGEAFASCLGFLWQELGWSHFDAYRQACSFGPKDTPNVLQDLPSYPWNHGSTYWAESRKSHRFRHREEFHPLLGFRSSEDHEMELRWRNVWSLREMPWLKGHIVQGQVVVPGVCYVVLGLEAAARLSRDRHATGTIELDDITIYRALIMDEDEDQGTDVFVTVCPKDSSSTGITGTFNIYASSGYDKTPYRVCSANIQISAPEDASQQALPDSKTPVCEEGDMSPVPSASFYSEMEKIGLRWDEPFLCGTMQRVHHRSILSAARSKTDPHEGKLLLSPVLLDIGFQGALVGFCAPGDGRLWNPYIPTHIDRCVFDVGRLKLSGPEFDSVQFSSFILHSSFPNLSTTATFTCDVHGSYSVDGEPFLKVEGLTFSCVSPAQKSDDREMFSEEVWMPMAPSEFDLPFRELHDPLGRASDFMRQLTLRNPRMSILEIGGNHNLLTSILDSVDGAFSKLHFAYQSHPGDEKSIAAQLEAVKTRFERDAGRITLLPLDPGKTMLDRDSSQAFYDLIISSQVLQPEYNIKTHLQSFGRLLKPGGLVMMSTTSPASSWSKPLKDNGFSGVDFVLSEDSRSSLIVTTSNHSNDIATTQATNSEAENVDDILVIGGNVPETLNVLKGLQRRLGAMADRVKVIKGLAELGSSGIPAKASVLCLADLETDTLKSPTMDVLDGMKILFETETKVLWVTRGRRIENPYASMMVGLGRSVISESPLLRLQFLDVEDSLSTENTVKSITDCFQTLAASKMVGPADTEEEERAIEPELVLSNGKLLISRIQPLGALNDRLNCQNRVIKKNLGEPSGHVLEIVRSGSFQAIQECDGCTTRETITVSHSLNAPLQLASRISGYLGLGENSSGDKFLILSSRNRNVQMQGACAVVPCSGYKGTEADLLIAVASTIFIRNALEESSSGRLLLHQPNEMGYHLARRLAHNMGLEVCISMSTVDQSPAALDPQELRQAVISQFTTWRSLTKNLSGPVESLIYLPGLASVEDRATASHLLKLAPANCRRLTFESVTASNYDETRVVPGRHLDQAEEILHTALEECSQALASIMPFAHDQASCASLTDIYGTPAADKAIKVIDWTKGSPVDVHVQPRTPTSYISSDKTYLLVGLTGDLGRSLVLWMIRAGARHFVLTSRSPNVPQSWLRSCKEIANDVDVRAMKMDVTNEQDVRAVYEQINKTMPPVGGVANAAMVMDDSLFSMLDTKAFQRVANPKVAGSLILDKVFHDIDLDFFILFSSISSVVGNRAQSSYCAANLAQATIAAQRRQRGLAASALDLGMVVGIGYVARAGSTVDAIKENMRMQNGIPLGETDVHNVFLEAIVRGKEMHETAELITGLRCVRPEDEYLPLWHDNPRFAHLSRLDNPNDSDISANKSDQTKVSVKERLQNVTSPEDATEAVRGALKSKLEIMLKSRKEDIPDDTALVQIGVDSLSAVEIRTWFVKEVGCDIPVLKILNGASVNSLCAEAVKQASK